MITWRRILTAAAVLLLSSVSSFVQAQAATDKQSSASQENPTPIKKAFSNYPDAAVKKWIEGTVVLNVVIDAKGKVSDAKAVSGPPELTQAAIDCVKLWEYAPPIHSPATATVKFEFHLY